METKPVRAGFSRLIFAFLFILGHVAPAAAYEVLDNGKLRFGNGSEASVNANGNLRQPFYHDGNLGGFYPLTFSTYPLDNAIGIDGDGTSEWNLNGTVVENSALASQVLDVSGFTLTSGSRGYGTIVSTGTVTIAGKALQFRNTYTLGQNDAFVRIVTRITNTGGATASNVRVWVGTRDDFVGTSDQPLKERGNLTNGQFVAISSTATRAPALRITSGQTGVLFYSNSPKAHTVIDYCCSFSNAYTKNPATNPVSLGGDGSYALFVRMSDLAPGASEEFTWYYAAGAVSDLTAIVNDVAQEAQSWTVTANAGAGGSISPGSATVADNATTAFTVTPSAGYSIDTVQGCGGSLAGNTYTTGAVTANCTVTATFRLNSHLVSVSAGAGGSLSPASATVNHGATRSFTVTPATGYSIASVQGCGGTLNGTTFTTGAITAPCTITASFVLNTYTVTAVAGSGGGIGPSSAVVNHGASTSFTVTPAAGFSIATVQGCGGTLNGNTFTTGAVTAGCTVTASFVLNTYVVSAVAGSGGAIGPASATVSHGGTTSFSLTPDVGYEIAGVQGCGGTLNGTLYTTGPVTGACAVTASFVLKRYTVTATAGDNGAISPGSVTVDHGSAASFTVTPAAGFSIGAISGCGGALNGNTYTTASVTAACAVSVQFVLTRPVFNPASPPPYEMQASGLMTELPQGIAPVATDYQGAALTVTLEVGATRFAPGEHMLTWRAVDSRGVAATVQQVLRVWPIVSMGKDVSLGFRQGNSGSFRIALNGLSPVYPFSVNYSASGYLQGHDLQSGTAVFAPGETVKDIYFAVMQTAAAGSPSQEVRVALDEGVNRGARREVVVTLVTVNAAPVVTVSGQQDGAAVPVFARTGGQITLVADVQDPNSNDTHTLQWSAPNGAVTSVQNGRLIVTASSLPAGVHRFQVVATDNGSPVLNSRGVFDLVLREAVMPLPQGVQAWAANGLPDDPAYSPVTPNILPERRGELHHYIVESDPGVTLRVGPNALLSGQAQAELENMTAIFGADTVANVGGYFDFIIDNLPQPGQSANVVLPQRAPIPQNPVYRKFNTAAHRWQTFMVDASNALASAPGVAGHCPPPSSSEYRPGLNPGDWCVRLTLSDGGPNDDDGQVNGSISDPGGVAAMASVVVTGTGSGSGGGGSMDLLLLVLGLSLLVLRRRLPQRLRTVFLASALAVPAAASADSSPLDLDKWYFGGDFGQARGEVTEADINARLAAEGYDVTARYGDRNRGAWRIFVGYEWNRHVEARLGYTELGEADITYAGNVVDIQEFLQSANRLQPHSANGVELSLVGRYPLMQRLSVFWRGGVFRWDSDYRARDAGSAFARLEDSGTDGFLGMGFEIAVRDGVNLGAEWNRYGIDGEDVDFAGIGLVYRFGG